MDIGTGKDLGDYSVNGVRVPYHLIDIVEAGAKYNIFQYQRDFIKAYNDITARGKLPILCGGSGLYIEAATRGYALPEVPPDPKLRERLEKLPMEELSARLASMKSLHNVSDLDSKKRVIRAIEIAIVTLYLTGQLTYVEMEFQLATAIHQFAKRQMTWFRGMERRGINIEWVENL